MWHTLKLKKNIFIELYETKVLFALVSVLQKSFTLPADNVYIFWIYNL